MKEQSGPETVSAQEKSSSLPSSSGATFSPREGASSSLVRSRARELERLQEGESQGVVLAEKRPTARPRPKQNNPSRKTTSRCGDERAKHP